MAREKKNPQNPEFPRLYQQMGNYIMNSLNNAIFASDLLECKAEKLPEEYRDESLTDSLSILRRSQFQLLRLAENLRDLTQLEEGSFQLRKSTVDLNQLCLDLVESLRTLLPDLEFIYREPETECVTVCDPDRIERLLLNLLSNSLLHCQPGGTVRIRLQRTEETLQIIVADNGSGIPRENTEALFTDYLRAPEPAEEHRGAGLGLSVAHMIARAHGGSLVVTSEAGHGTKAVFSLPKAWPSEFVSWHPPRKGRMRTLLVGLSDVLDHTKFRPPFL